MAKALFPKWAWLMGLSIFILITTAEEIERSQRHRMGSHIAPAFSADKPLLRA